MGTPTSPFKTSENEGISIEILSMVMRKMGMEDYRFILVDSVERAILSAQSGKVEMLIGYSKKAERLAFLAYPARSYRRIKWNFFIRKQDEGKIRFETFEDLKGYTIGVTRSVSYTKEFWAAQSMLHFDFVNQNELQIKKLLRGRVDLVPLNTRSTLYEAEQAGIRDKIAYLPKPIKDKPYYDPVSIHSDYFGVNDTDLARKQRIQRFLERYDEAIVTLEREGIIADTYQKYGLEYDL